MKCENKSFIKLASSIFLASGIAISGYYIGESLKLFRVGDRTLTVKGLVEESVKSDKAIWTIKVSSSHNDLLEAQQKLNGDLLKVLAFLKSRGFEDSDISTDSFRVTDRQKNTNNSGAPESWEPFRIETSLKIITSKVEQVQQSIGLIHQLIAQGIIVDASDHYQNPAFLLNNFESLRPEMLSKSIQSALKMGEQFSKDTGAKLGAIRHSSQGAFQIFGTENNGDYNHEKSINKRIRLVTTVTFSLN
jgi:hypothetical protein